MGNWSHHPQSEPLFQTEKELSQGPDRVVIPLVEATIFEPLTYLALEGGPDYEWQENINQKAIVKVILPHHHLQLLGHIPNTKA